VVTAEIITVPLALVDPMVPLFLFGN